MQKYYTKLKEYLTNYIRIDSQFIYTKKLLNLKVAGSIMFNIVEQINTKLGGINFILILKVNNR